MNGYTKEKKVGDEIELIYGKSLPRKQRTLGDIPVYGSNGIVDYHIENCFKGPGIIVGRKGTVGAVNYSKGDFWAIDTTYILKLKSQKDDIKFWYYFLKTLNLEQMNTHSAVPGLNRESVYALKTKIVASYSERKKIANILSTLDEKIETNNLTNEKLEDMAQAIFKHWFVDFEFPNEEGKPYRSSGGAMVESELGMIPEGWKVGTLKDFITISSGKRPLIKSDKQNSENQIPLVGASSIMGFTTTYNYNEAVLVIGRVGTHGVIQRFDKSIWASDNTLVIKTDYYEFVYQILNIIDYASLNRGSTQPLITQKDVTGYKLVISNNEVLNTFERLISKLFDKKKSNILENDKLGSIRNTLLPKLMSGEIRVPLDDENTI